VTRMTNYCLPLLIAATGTATFAAEPAAATRYLQEAAGSSLTFTFVQGDAATPGSFRQFTTDLSHDARNPAADRLKVIVQIASLDTGDKERDDTLKGADLFDAAKYPTAQYAAESFARREDGGLEAVGKLTLRGVTRELRIPLTLRASGDGLELSGETTIRRLDYGVGQGEWQATDWVGNDVRLQYKVKLAKAG